MMNALSQGLILMAAGMRTVFAFLLLLVLAMHLSASFFRRFARLFPEPEPKQHIERLATDHADIALAVAAVKALTR